MGGATPSTPHSPTILVFHQLANRWKDLLAKKVKGKDGNEGKEGRRRKKAVTHILNDEQIYERSNQRLCSSYISFPSVWRMCQVHVCVYRGDIWLGSLLGLCNVSIWCVCLSGLQNGGSQIVRGKVMSTSSDERESG